MEFVIGSALRVMQRVRNLEFIITVYIISCATPATRGPWPQRSTVVMFPTLSADNLPKHPSGLTHNCVYLIAFLKGD